MDMKTAEDVELGLMIDFAFDEVKACENGWHGKAEEIHEGDAEWYIRTVCPVCGNDSGVYASCDLWKRAVETYFCQCHCGASGYALEGALVLAEKIK